MTKIVIIGLDGVGWDVIDLLNQEELCPNLEKLKSESLLGELESSVPPVTFPAWKCLSTGKDPSKLGVYWWMNLDYKNQKFYVNSSKDFKGKEIWDFLSEVGLKSIIINTPGMYPAKEINGIIISGSPNPYLAKSVYPKNVFKELEQCKWKNMPDTPWAGKSDRIIKECINIHDNQVNYALKLKEREPWDFFMFTFFLTDPILHHFWEEHQSLSDKNNKKTLYLRKFWKNIDKYIGEFAKGIDDDTYLFLVSDHGMGEMKYKFRLNCFLEKRGYLKLKKKVNIADRIFLYLKSKKIVEFAEKMKIINPMSQLLDIIGLSNRLNPANDISLREDLIDWKKTTALCLSDCWGLIYTNNLNEKGKKNLVQDLKNIKKNGENVFTKILKATDVYSNVQEHSPDFIAVPRAKYEISSGLAKNMFKTSSDDVWGSTHTKQGLYLINGPNICKGNEPLKIYDIAPTVLSLFGIHSDGFDGNDIFSNGKSYEKTSQSLHS
jgi:predicted AlkP superfamily phosphohydrolase/phosphomutase